MSSGRVTPSAGGKGSAMSGHKSEAKSGAQTPALDKSTPIKEPVVEAPVEPIAPVDLTKRRETLDNIKSQLRDVQANGGSSQATVYSHLTEVFNRCVQKHPTDAFDKFEEMSVLIKKTQMSFSDPKSDF